VDAQGGGKVNKLACAQCAAKLPVDKPKGTVEK
jgi:hypothetical protein